jgi:hypothetical protein
VPQLTPPYPIIRQSLRAGQVIPFLGAGASLGSRPPNTAWVPPPPTQFLPTGGELAEHLANQAVFPPGEEKDLAKVAQFFAVQVGRPRLQRALREVFGHPFAPLPIHRLLAEVQAHLLIVTTNYDTLIEQAFDDAGRPYDVVIHTSDAKFGDRILHRPHGAPLAKPVEPHKLLVDLTRVTVVYKIHGSCNPQQPAEDQYVITEDDYIDFLSRMVRKRAIPAFCAEPFRDWPFLFLGYRLNDWNMRVVLNRIAQQLRSNQAPISWVIEREPSLLEERFWQNRGVNVYAKSIDDFVHEIRPV